MANEVKKAKNLAIRLAELQWSAQEIEKTGKNINSNYDYKTFTNIKKAIIVKMRELGLALIPGELSKEERDFKIEQVSNARYRVSYFTRWHLLCGETDEERTFTFLTIGTNTDGEKANGAAITYELKYIFNAIGLIPDESLDPDNEEKSNTKNGKTQNDQPSSLSGEREALLTSIKKLENELNKVEGSNIGTDHLKLMLGLSTNQKITKEFMYQQKLIELKVIKEALTKKLAKIKTQLGE